MVVVEVVVAKVVVIETGHGFELVRRAAVPCSARKISKMASKFLV